MHTILSSATKTVRIGDDQPFAIIGERINPTGRKIFQLQLRNGDLSRVEIDVKEQVAGGAMLLDVNMGAPLADEAELMTRAVTLIQQLTDLPLVIDSSIIEVLDAGLAAYQGKALVNSVTAEDERLDAILPLVKKYGAAVIGLPNDEEEIPEEPARRVELVRKLIHVATEKYKIGVEDIVIDPLAMPVGADTLHPSRTLETIALIKSEFGVNMTLGASNVSFGMPDRHSIAATFLPIAIRCGLTSAIMDARAPQIVRAVKAADLVLNRDEWGAAWIAAHRGPAGGPAGDRASGRAGQGTRSARSGRHVTAEETATQPVRVNLVFNDRPVRVPYGVTLFDAASWNGIAIDSTCGGHGTCKKCRIRIADDPPAPTSLDIRAYTAAEIRDGWRLACRTTATQDTQVEVPPLTTRPKAATVGVGRQVILRPAVQKRYLELAEPSLADQASDVERVLAQLDDLEPRAELSVLKTLGRTLREADYKVTAVVVDDVLIAVEPGDTTGRRFGIAFDLGTTTVVATLLDLSTGTPAGVESMLNKQQPFGADVITRISATMMDPGALDKLQQLAAESLGELARAVCAQGGVQPHEVYEVAVAGNATMTHLVLGIDPEPLGMAPFIMSTRLLPEVLAADLGLAGAVHPRARAVVFPAFGAYVGGDITAGLLASGMDRDARIRLFVDIGTNCEIVLGNRDWLLATAAPAGPAFEGAAIRCGMRAADGAIEVVAMTAGRTGPEGDRRRRAAGPVRLRPGRRGDRPGPAGPARLLGPVHPRGAGRGGGTRPGGPAEAHRQGTGVRAALAGSGRAGQHLPVPARRPRAAVRQGGDRHRLADPARGGRPDRGRRQAGAAGRVVRQLPVGGQRDQDRPGPQGARAAGGVRGQRGGRGGEDGAAQPARAGRRPGAARGGEVCRALRPRRLQRPLRRAATLPRFERRAAACPTRALRLALRSSPAGRWPGTSARSWPAAAGRPP